MKQDDNNKSKLVYHNLEDEVRFDLEAAVDNEENEDEIESKVHLDLEVKAIISQPIGRCQIKSDIYTQISVISIEGCKYFKCNTCPQQYKHSASTKNICNHLFK